MWQKKMKQKNCGWDVQMYQQKIISHMKIKSSLLNGFDHFIKQMDATKFTY